MEHEVRGKDVDMELIGAHIRVLGRHHLESLVPIRHRVNDAVGLCRRSQVTGRPRTRKLEGVVHDPIDAAPREHALLDDEFGVSAGVHAPAYLRVLALDVLANHVEIDVFRTPVSKRRDDAAKQPHGAQSEVLLKAAPYGDEQSPQRHVIGHARKSHRAEKDGVVASDLLDAILGHHAPGARVVLAAPGKLVELILDAEAPSGGLENTDALGHDLVADTVTGNHGDAILAHADGPRAQIPRAPNGQRQERPELNPAATGCHGGYH